MIRYYKRCKTCEVIRKEGGEQSPLLKRIYNSRHFDSDGEPLTQILEAYSDQLKYLSLYKHTKNHQSLTDAELANRKIDKLEARVLTAKIESLTTGQFRDKLKAKAYEKLEGDEVKGWTVSSIAKVLKDEDDVAAKQKDQQIKILGMIEGFQSGAFGLPAATHTILDPDDYSTLPAEV